MPRAKTEKRSSAPPENRLTQPNSVLDAASKNDGERLPVDSGRGHGDAERGTRQHHGREQQPAAQLGDARGV